MTETSQCKAIKKDGTRCENNASPGAEFCHIKSHQAQAAEESAAQGEQTPGGKTGANKLRSFAPWLIGFLGVGGIVGGYFLAVVQEFLPSPHELACIVSELSPEPFDDRHFKVLVATLDDDPGSRQTNHVVAALLGEQGIDARSTCRVLDVELGSQSEAMDEGRQWLEDRDADVLIWGEVTKADKAIRIWFLSRQQASNLGKAPYQINDALVLPTNFHEDLGAQLAALALVAVKPATEEAGTYLVETLKPVATKLRQLAENLPADMPVDARGSVFHALGLAATVIGRQSGDAETLEQAVTAYCAALEERARERVPLDWAMTQVNLGKALATLGERTNNRLQLEQAIEAIRNAYQVVHDSGQTHHDGYFENLLAELQHKRDALDDYSSRHILQ